MRLRYFPILTLPTILRMPDGEGGGGAGDGGAGAGGASGGAPGGAPGAGGAADLGSFGALDAALAKVVADNGWKSPADAVRNYQSTASKLGSMVSIPGADAKPEEIAAFHAKLGVPPSPDKYDLSDFKAPERAGWDAEAQNAFVGAMHKAGATPGVLKAALGTYKSFVESIVAKRDAHADTVAKAAGPTLQKEWGDQYDAHYAAANKAVAKVFGTDLEAAKQIRLEDGSFLLDNVALARAFSKLGAVMLEDGGLAGLGGGGGAGAISTPEQAKAEIAKIRSEAMRDPKHPYLNPADPLHDDLHKRMLELHKIAAGNAAVTD